MRHSISVRNLIVFFFVKYLAGEIFSGRPKIEEVRKTPGPKPSKLRSQVGLYV